MFGLKSDKRFIIGTKQVKNAIKSGKASKVYIASDCDPEIISPVAELAEQSNLEVFYVLTRRELGEMCGINVKAACAVQTL